jgi:hypothetical protein
LPVLERGRRVVGRFSYEMGHLRQKAGVVSLKFLSINRFFPAEAGIRSFLWRQESVIGNIPFNSDLVQEID